MSAAIGQLVVAAVAVSGAVAALYLWATRQVIREELQPVRSHLARQGEDIAVLRTAVFNHLAHGDQPVEAHIREVLGYGRRG